jgi:hypothetical protein
MLSSEEEKPPEENTKDLTMEEGAGKWRDSIQKDKGKKLSHEVPD